MGSAAHPVISLITSESHTSHDLGMKTSRIIGLLALTAVGTRLLLDRERAYSFKDRLVVISGGSRGLGLILARNLIEQGAKVALCARDHTELARAIDHLGQLVERLDRGDVFGERCDVTSPSQVAGFLKSVRAWGGPIDVLINNAGVMTVGPAESMSPSDYEETFDVHIKAPLALINGVLPDMRAHVSIGWLPIALGLLEHLVPETLYEGLSLAERLTPHPHPTIAAARSGKHSPTTLSPSILTRLSDIQVARNNE